jgi:hypothetical protein
MNSQSKCSNCGKEIANPGHVLAAFYPFLTVFLGFPAGRFCEDCAFIINALGFVATFVGVAGLLAWVFWYVGA